MRSRDALHWEEVAQWRGHQPALLIGDQEDVPRPLFAASLPRQGRPYCEHAYEAAGQIVQSAFGKTPYVPAGRGG